VTAGIAVYRKCRENDNEEDEGIIRLANLFSEPLILAINYIIKNNEEPHSAFGLTSSCHQCSHNWKKSA
jgi:hypothetical protein